MVPHWTRRLILLAALAASALPAMQARASAEDIAVIVPPGGLGIPYNMLTLRDVFLRRISIDRDGHPIIPLNLPAGSPVRRAFSESLLNATPQALQSYWNERYFHGVSPPHVLDSPEAMMRFVAKTPGAVGYVPSCLVDPRVKVVADFPVPPELREPVARMCPGAAAAH